MRCCTGSSISAGVSASAPSATCTRRVAHADVPIFGKIRLADHLPRSPGVYLFRARDGRVLYVGTSKDLRARVKSYFYGDERKKVQDLLAEVVSVEGRPTAGEVHALALEARLIARHEPPYNRRGKVWRRYAYLKLDTHEPWPRIKVVRAVGTGGTTLGPFGSSAKARLAKEAIEEVFPIRRCTASMRARTRFAPCVLADIGRCLAPCDGRTDPERYGELVGTLLSSLSAPGGLLGTLEVRMTALARQERFEEAALARDRLRAVAEALWRRRVDAWLTNGRLVLRGPEGERIELIGGAPVVAGDPTEPIGSPCSRDRSDELGAVRSWIARHRVRLEACEVAPAEPVSGGADLARILRQTRPVRPR